MIGRHDHPEVALHSFSLAQYMKCVDADDWAGVAELMLASAERCAKAGADFLICPDNTIHQCFDLVEHRSPRPWLHIAREVAKEAKQRGYKRLAVLGTRYLMEGPVYREAFKAAGTDYRVPGAEQRQRINQIIFDELVNGQFLPRSLAYYVEIIRTMKDEGCDAVVLGCTEIPLLLNQSDRPDVPMFDTAGLHVEAVMQLALATD